MRAMFAVAASGLGGIGSVVASFDGHADFVPFYAGLAFCAAVAAAPVPDQTFLGIPATAYYVAALSSVARP